MEMEHAANPAHVVVSNEDLLSKILSLLPIKDLLRFKLVSKDWRALISHPSFCRLRNPNPNPAAGIFLPPPRYNELHEYVPFSPLKFSFLKSRVRQLNFPHSISQSCNGLLLFKSYSKHYVYNPTTDSRSELPETVGERDFLKYMTLVFDPVKSRHYNVVCIWFLERGYPSNDQLMIEMYSSETSSWRVCGEPFPPTVNFENGVYWNGAVHWLSLDNEGGLYFQVENQILKKMPVMPFHNDSTYGSGYYDASQYYFGHSCDHMHLIEYPHSKDPFNVYEMKNDYSEWFVKYRVDLSPVIEANLEMREWVLNYNGVDDYKFSFCVSNVIRGVAEEDSFLVVMTRVKLIRYNLVSEIFENLYEFEDSRYPEERGLEYIESLCCV